MWDGKGAGKGTMLEGRDLCESERKYDVGWAGDIGIGIQIGFADL